MESPETEEIPYQQVFVLMMREALLDMVRISLRPKEKSIVRQGKVLSVQSFYHPKEGPHILIRVKASDRLTFHQVLPKDKDITPSPGDRIWVRTLGDFCSIARDLN